MSTSRPFFDLATPDHFRSLPPRSLSAVAPRASSLPRFVVGSAPASRIDQQGQRASTPCASTTCTTPPSFSNVATPAPSSTSGSDQPIRRSLSPSCTASFVGLPALNLDATAQSTTVSQQRPARSVSFATVSKEPSTAGQPSSFSAFIRSRRQSYDAEVRRPTLVSTTRTVSSVTIRLNDSATQRAIFRRHCTVSVHRLTADGQ